MKNYILMLISLLSIIACSKQENTTEPKMIEADKVIFGAVFGNCGGDCRDLYLLNNEDLFKDADNTSDEWEDWSHTTFEEKLDREKYSQAEKILEVPESLLEQETPENIIVQVYADFDYYLYIEKDGKSMEYIFDDINEDASLEVKAYFQEVLTNYEGLKEILPGTISNQ